MNPLFLPGQKVLARGRNVVGIDIGKNKHSAVAISAQGEKLASLAIFTNDNEGINILQERVLAIAGSPKKILFALEATGHYWMAIYHELVRRGYQGVVLNPIQTNGEARTRIRKTKTDKRDAEGIARFILTGKAHATRIMEEATAELRIMTRRRYQLLQMKNNLERNAQSLTDRIFPEYDRCFSEPFLTSGRTLIREIGLSPCAIVDQEAEARELLYHTSRKQLKLPVIDRFIQHAKDSIGIGIGEATINQELRSTIDMIEYVEQQISTIDQELKARMAERDTPLLSLGIGAPLAALIHAESDPIEDFHTARQYAAYAGLEPSTFESGEMRVLRTHISKRGSPHLRRALYLSAMGLYKKHAYFERIYLKFRKKGHQHNSAIVIVARHIAMVIWRMLKDNRKFSKRPPKKE